MIIDVNVSLSRWPFRRLLGDETPDLVARLREQKVVKAWAGSFDGILHKDIGAVNARLAAECRSHGENVLVPFGVVTPIFFDTVIDAAALLFARGADFLSVFDKAQREAFVTLLLNLHHQRDLAIDFWGLWLIPFVLLVYRSRFLPRVLGVRLMIACFEYPALNFTGLLFPVYEEKVFKFAQRVLFAVVAIMLWFVIMGAGEKRLAAATSLRTEVTTQRRRAEAL
jgi:hypothetical protein